MLNDWMKKNSFLGAKVCLTRENVLWRGYVKKAGVKKILLKNANG